MTESSTSAGATPPERNIKRFVTIAGVGFVLTALLIFFGAGFIKPDIDRGYAPTAVAVTHTDGTHLITFDVADRNNWVGVDLLAGRVVDGAGADIIAQRYILQAPAGAADLGEVSLEAARATEGTEWISDKAVDRVLQNAAFGKWYSYSYFSHLLTPLGHTYAVRLANGQGVAYVKIVSYYCKPEGSGCLTLRYRVERR